MKKKSTSAKINKNNNSKVDNNINRNSNAKHQGNKNSSKVHIQKKVKEKAEDKTPRSQKLLHQVMPFIMYVIALFLIVCFLMIDVADSGDAMGTVGQGLHNILCGFLGVGALFIPVLIIFFGAFWHKNVDDYKMGQKTFCAFLTLISISSLFHVSEISAGNLTDRLDFVSMWDNGIDFHGGGVIGGFMGALSHYAFGSVGSVIIISSVVFVFAMFFFGLTPRSICIYIRYKSKIHREKKAVALAEAKKREDERQLKLRRMSIGELTDMKTDLNANSEDDALDKQKKGKFKIQKKDNAAAEGELCEDDESICKGTVFVEPTEDYINHQHEQAAFAIDDTHKAQTGVIKAEEFRKTQDIEDEVGDDFKLETVFNENKAIKTTTTDLVNELSIIDDKEAESEIEALSTGEQGMDVDEIDDGIYMFPPIDLLPFDTSLKDTDNGEELRENAKILIDTLESFNIKIKEITYSRGPTITRYELKPEAGIRVRSIANLVDDIALGLATTGVRIEAPIPNKPAVGIEVPNRNRATVFLRDMIDSDKFANETSKLTACLGRDVAGKPIYFNIAKMPHLLIAGATGMGKSVCINSIILSLLYKAKPSELKLILIDPKKVEFNIYKDIPHLYAPIVTDPKKAAGALATAVCEMERRFELIEEVGVRDITNYNIATADDPDKEFMPQMVIIIDELADLMMTAPDDVETSIARLTAKARAAGIHLIIGTQRPSVDVITGTIKSNIPSRIAFTVASQIDSRTIIDIAGAEKLIGMGDMLFAPVGISKPLRVQGAFVHENDVEAIVDFIKKNNHPVRYNDAFIRQIEEEAAKCALGKKGSAAAAASLAGHENGGDCKLRDALELAIETGKISTSLLQRRIGVGYGRAAKLIDRMEDLGYVSPPDGNKPRRILITKEMYMEKVLNDEIETE